jgi:hypothetical protein
MRCVGVLLLLSWGSVAWAGDKLLPGSQANPPLYVDESSTIFYLGGNDEGYGVVAKLDMVNGATSDRVRLEVKKAGKLLQKVECSLNGRRDFAGQVHVECSNLQAPKKLTVTGPIEAELIYEDDKTDKEYLLRTFKVNVKHWNKPTWQIEADDLVATAYLVPSPAQTGEDAVLRFWTTGNRGFSAVLRCTVDGKPINDLDGSVTDDESFDADILSGNKRTTWLWTKSSFHSTWWKVAAPKGDKPSSDYAYLNQHPGTWECQLRRSGITVREFKFTVNAKGEVESHPMQQAPDAAPLVPRFALIEVRIPKDNGLDQRIKPDALKKSRGFGLPWPKHDSVKAVLAALPPAFENAKPPAAKKPAGKLLIGSEEKPAKVVDESTAAVRVQSRSPGYTVHAEQMVSGVTQAPGNMYRLEWKQGGKTLATIRCWTNKTDDRAATWSRVDCEDNEQVLTAKGAVEGHLIYTDDSAGKEYLMRVYKVTVAKYPSKGDAVWQVVPDDVLATAWVRQRGDQVVHLAFWLALEDPSVDFRCTVDGKSIPDFSSSGGDANSIEAQVSTGKGTTKYVWQQTGTTYEMYAGMPPKDYKTNPDRVSYFGERPGKWDCQVRQKGKVLRQLLFTVNSKGYAEADPAQPGVYPDWVVPIEMRFGKDILDVRVRPDAMKKSRGFGLPWPKPPTKTFPPASGLPDPK